MYREEKRAIAKKHFLYLVENLSVYEGGNKWFAEFLNLEYELDELFTEEDICSEFAAAAIYSMILSTVAFTQLAE